MNIHIYEGTDRYSSTRKLVKYNDPPTANEIYTVPADQGILVVAFPDKEDEDTILAFEYWVADKPVRLTEE